MKAIKPSFEREITDRYRAHILMPDIGGKGQQKLSKAKIIVVGAGGIGAPLLLYLTAAGISRITLVDHDHVEIENLQRQILFQESDLGKPKAEAAKKNLQKLNCQTKLKALKQKITKHNAIQILQNFDIIVDCSDNYLTRLVISDAAFILRTPLIMAAAAGHDGLIASFIPYEIDKNTQLFYPSFRCLYGFDHISTLKECLDIGVMTATTAIAASLQTNVILQYLLFEQLHYDNSLLLFDARNMRFEKLLRHFNRNNELTGDKACIDADNIGKLPKKIIDA